jgi:hypothetical protein
MMVVEMIDSGHGAGFMSLEICGVTPTISVYEMGVVTAGDMLMAEDNSDPWVASGLHL